MIQLSKKSAQVLVISSILISLILIIARSIIDTREQQARRELQKQKEEQLIRENLISQMDTTANVKYVLLEKYKNGSIYAGWNTAEEAKNYQDMANFLRNGKLWFSLYDYKIEVAKSKPKPIQKMTKQKTKLYDIVRTTIGTGQKIRLND